MDVIEDIQQNGLFKCETSETILFYRKKLLQKIRT